MTTYKKLGLFARLSLRGVARKYAAEAGIVYFGAVDALRDEHVPIRGFTMSAAQKDDNFMSGTIQGIEVTLLNRYDVAGTKERPLPSSWLILKFSSPAGSIPHSLLLTHQHGRDYLEAVFIRLARYQHISLTPPLDQFFLVYGKPSDHDTILPSLETVSEQTIGSLRAYDIEFDGKDIMIHLPFTRIEIDDYRKIMQAGLRLHSDLQTLHA